MIDPPSLSNLTAAHGALPHGAGRPRPPTQLLLTRRQGSSHCRTPPLGAQGCGTRASAASSCLRRAARAAGSPPGRTHSRAQAPTTPQSLHARSSGTPRPSLLAARRVVPRPTPAPRPAPRQESPLGDHGGAVRLDRTDIPRGRGGAAAAELCAPPRPPALPGRAISPPGRRIPRPPAAQGSARRLTASFGRSSAPGPGRRAALGCGARRRSSTSTGKGTRWGGTGTTPSGTCRCPSSRSASAARASSCWCAGGAPAPPRGEK